MEIKFIQDYKNYKKGSTVKVGKIAGNNLIKKGLAEKIVRFPIKKLYVCEIGKFNSKKLNGFESENRYGIFIDEGRYGLFNGFYLYEHVVTGMEFKQYSYYAMDMAGVEHNDLIVNNPKPFYKVFFKQIQEKGWNLNSKLTIEEVKAIENKLNKESSNEIVK